MLKTQVSKQAVDLLSEEIKNHYDLPMLERGLEYQQKGYVYNAEVTDKNVLTAKVQGTTTYHVKVDLDFFAMSECSCPYDGYCKHLAAAFFYVYAVYGHPDHFVQQIRQASAASAVETSKTVRKNVLTLAEKSMLENVPGESASIEQWRQYFEEQFQSFNQHIGNKYYIEEFFPAALQSFAKTAQYWRAALRRMYTLHAVIFLLQKIEAHFDEARVTGNAGYFTKGYHNTSKQLMEQFGRTLQEIDTDEIYAKYEEHGEHTIHLLSIVCFREDETPVDWMSVYRTFWSKWSRQTEWTETEIRRLTQLEQQQHISAATKRLTLLALVHFDVISGRDDDAMVRLDRLPETGLEHIQYYIRSFVAEEQWERLQHWLRWLRPMLKNASRDTFNTLCGYWNEAAKHLPSDEEWVEVMISLLPRTYYFYTEHLMKTGRFKQWIEFHLANRISPTEVHPADLRQMESGHVHALLPFFHQSIERQIVQKNRTSYKMAVRLLKKLKGYYTTLGKPERFEQYMRQLANRYSRLRAFQEELKKGKLFS